MLCGCSHVSACRPSASLMINDDNKDDHITPVLCGIGGVVVGVNCEVQI